MVRAPLCAVCLNLPAGKVLYDLWRPRSDSNFSHTQASNIAKILLMYRLTSISIIDMYESLREAGIVGNACCSCCLSRSKNEPKTVLFIVSRGIII